MAAKKPVKSSKSSKTTKMTARSKKVAPKKGNPMASMMGSPKMSRARMMMGGGDTGPGTVDVPPMAGYARGTKKCPHCGMSKSRCNC